MPATILGAILNANGAPRRTMMKYIPLSGPLVENSALITTTQPRIITSHSDGTFTIDLEQGDYRVEIGDRNSALNIVQIAVPNDELDHQFVDLITQELTYIFPITPSEGTPIATKDVTGTVKTHASSGDPTVPLWGEVEPLFKRVHQQLTPATIWEITHSLSHEPVAITISDAGERIFGDESYPAADKIRVNFGAAISGKLIYS